MSSDIRDKIKSVLCRKYKQGKNVGNQHQHPHKKQGESSYCDSGQQQQQQQQQQQEQPQQHLQEEEEYQTTIAERQSILLGQNEGEECCSSRTCHSLNDDRADFKNITSNMGVRTVPTSAATLTTVSSVPPLMTSEHQTISTTETSITAAALITSPTSFALLLSSSGVLSSSSTPEKENDTACTLPRVESELCKSCEFDVSSTVSASKKDAGGIQKESCEDRGNENKLLDHEFKNIEHSNQIPSANGLTERADSDSTHEAETEFHEQQERGNASPASKIEKEKYNQPGTSDVNKTDIDNTCGSPTSDVQQQTVMDITDVCRRSDEEVSNPVVSELEVCVHRGQQAQSSSEITRKEMVLIQEKSLPKVVGCMDACEKNKSPNIESEPVSDMDGQRINSIEQDELCEELLLGANSEIDDDDDDDNVMESHKNENIPATAIEANNSISSSDGVDIVLSGGAEGALSKVVWSGGSRFKSHAIADKDKGEAVLLDSDDDMMCEEIGDDEKDDIDEKHDDEGKDEKGDEGGRLDDRMLHGEESNVGVSQSETESCTKPVVGPDGLMDVFDLQKELDDGYDQLNQEFDEYRNNENSIQRLCADIKELKREVTHVREMNDRSRSTIRSLQDEVNVQRTNLTSACDSKSSMSKSDAQLQRLERKCYRDYYSMKDENDAKSLLDAIRDKIKSLTRLETLVHRKRLVLKHALPVTLKDAPSMKIPVAKKTRKLLDFTKNSVGGCRAVSKTTMNPVVVEILSCLADSGSASFMAAASSQYTSTHSSQVGIPGLTDGTPTPSTLSTDSDDVSLFARVVRHHQGTPVD